MGANLAPILAGQFMSWISHRQATFAGSLEFMMRAVVVSGGVMLGAYKYMQNTVVRKMEKSAEGVPARKKERMSMKESLGFLASSPYIRNMAILVMSSGLCLNLVEVSWKAKLLQQFPDPKQYAAFMGKFSTITGFVTLAMMAIGRGILGRFGWRTAALVTPAVSPFPVSLLRRILKGLLT